MRGAAPALAVLIATLLSACNGVLPPTPPPTTTHERSLSEILRKTREAVLDVTSYRFAGPIEGVNEKGPITTRMQGAWLSPDRYFMRTEDSSNSLAFNEVLYLGDRVLARESGRDGGAWQEQPYSVPIAGMLGPAGWFLPPPGRDVVLEGIVQVRGRSAYHVSWATDGPEPSSLPDRLSALQLRTTINVFIDIETFRPLRSVFRNDLSLPKRSDTNGTPANEVVEQWSMTTYDYFDYNDASITIDEPALHDGS